MGPENTFEGSQVIDHDFGSVEVGCEMGAVEPDESDAEGACCIAIGRGIADEADG